MPGTRADKVRNDNRILRAAARLLAQEPAASVQAIADAAGVSRLSVYRRYPDRDALITALRAAVDTELADVLAALPSWDRGLGAVEDLVRALARVAARYPVALLRYAPVPGGPSETDAAIAAFLTQGQRAGVVRADVAAETLNAALFAVLSAVAEADVALSLLLPGFAPGSSGVQAAHRPALQPALAPALPHALPTQLPIQLPTQEGRR